VPAQAVRVAELRALVAELAVRECGREVERNPAAIGAAEPKAFEVAVGRRDGVDVRSSDPRGQRRIEHRNERVRCRKPCRLVETSAAWRTEELHELGAQWADRGRPEPQAVLRAPPRFPHSRGPSRGEQLTQPRFLLVVSSNRRFGHLASRRALLSRRSNSSPGWSGARAKTERQLERELIGSRVTSRLVIPYAPSSSASRVACRKGRPARTRRLPA
jgi:hypothetical protein